ncbi:MAG: hypothetical protein C0485_04350 [Pirellula sp.]|nr:hypothetical protein [Pirellula sp.]
MAFADKLRFPTDEASLAIEAAFDEEFKRRTGFEFPKTDAEWRHILAAAGFSPEEERELRTKHASESEIAAYYSGPGELIETLYARLPKRSPVVDGFVPNTFQARILAALGGRALKKDALAAEVCGGEGSRLYRKGGIKELMAIGLVVNKQRLGYYRPDTPPMAGAN